MESARPHSSAAEGGADGNLPEHDAAKQGRDKNASQGTATSPRRSLSGSISSFMFSRSSSSSDHGTKSTPSAGAIGEPPPSPQAGTAMSTTTPQKGTRKRKGSLRKTALLVSGKSRMSEAKERQGASTALEERKSLEGDGDSSDGFGTDSGTLSTPSSPMSAVDMDMTTPRPFPIPPPVPMDTHPIQGDPFKISASSTTTSSSQHENTASFQHLHHRPSTAQSTASTTDDEELLLSSPTSPINLLIQQPPLIKPLHQATDSYFPLQPRLLPRPKPAAVATPKTRSPLSSTLSSSIPPASASSPPPSSSDEWDYSETRWWGWLILLSTWLVFVVGMGSCFEVWSWAWDVGETPSAPPELEDDPTLPIVGYYPALLVLTGVMAWVWVTIAWVGMKYFKHANISGDEDLVT